MWPLVRENETTRSLNQFPLKWLTGLKGILHFLSKTTHDTPGPWMYWSHMGRHQPLKNCCCWRNHAPWLQTILQSYNNQNNIVLIQKQAPRSVEQNRDPRNKPMHYDQSMMKEAIIYNEEKTTSSLSGTGKIGQGSNLCHSNDPSHSSNNTESLTTRPPGNSNDEFFS